MSKAWEENPYRNLGRTRKMQSLIRGGKDSNFPSIGMSLIEIIKINMLRGISRNKIPWKKGEDHWSNMIEVEGKIINQPVAILIDSGASHCYIDPNIVDRLHLEKSKLGKASLVQLAIGTKRRIHHMVRSCSMSLNGMNTSIDLNVIPLGSYDILIGMDWLDKHHVVLDCHNKTFTCLDGNGK
jgi:hypothetical protein